jgi:hypothetical protein
MANKLLWNLDFEPCLADLSVEGSKCVRYLRRALAWHHGETLEKGPGPYRYPIPTRNNCTPCAELLL